MASSSAPSKSGLDDLGVLVELCRVARNEYGLGQPGTERYWHNFACMASDAEFEICVSRSCRLFCSTYCQAKLCCKCCTDLACVGCAYHRLAAEHLVVQIAGEPADAYRLRVGQVFAGASAGNVRLDYGAFARAMQGMSAEHDADRPATITLERIARPVSEAALIDALQESLQRGSPVPPRLCLAASFSSLLAPGVTIPRVRSTVYLCTRMFVLPQRDAAVYRAVCANPVAIRARSVFMRDNLRPLEIGPPVDIPADAVTELPSEYVFDDDCSSQAMSSGRDGRPVVLIIHAVRTKDNKELKFASCSCNEHGVMLVDDLVTTTLSHTESG